MRGRSPHMVVATVLGHQGQDARGREVLVLALCHGSDLPVDRAGKGATRLLAVGCFGAGTGAAAALVAATEPPQAVRAVVSRGGRPDLAGEALEAVRAPTLLIVGGADEAVIEMNRKALQRMAGA